MMKQNWLKNIQGQIQGRAKEFLVRLGYKDSNEGHHRRINGWYIIEHKRKEHGTEERSIRVINTCDERNNST